MFQAYGAAMRSSAAGRQVGACVINSDGDALAVGSNEVAKAFGGQVWEEDGEDKDGRDHQRGEDPTTQMTNSILSDLLSRIKKAGWLKEDLADLSAAARLARATTDVLPVMQVDGNDPPSLGETARITHLLEFIRAVHAEMAALTSAAIRGVSLRGGTLYSTTFPCRECARHIVAAGIERVVFIEPYPKSKVEQL